MKFLRINGAKRVLVNVAVDIASILLITAAGSTGAIGFTTLYTSYAKTLTLPTPESFSSASLQFASTISFIFAVIFTRKYRIKEDPPGTTTSSTTSTTTKSSSENK